MILRSKYVPDIAETLKRLWASKRAKHAQLFQDEALRPSHPPPPPPPRRPPPHPTHRVNSNWVNKTNRSPIMNS
eukprot:5552723-Pyramimonas_sp.AAC.1